MAKSHPTYDRDYNREYEVWGKQPEKTLEERLLSVEAIDPYSEEGYKMQEESTKLHGRAWWLYAGWSLAHNRKFKYWIEQFMVSEKR